MATKPAIPLILGSVRPNNNCDGLASFIIDQWHQKISSESDLPSIVSAKELMPPNLSLPIGPFEEPRLSHGIHAPEEYTTPEVQEWSKIIRSAPAVIIITPQYNWGIPGQLKNLLDHLFNEWNAKPFLIITYGGHGGSKCAEQLSSVIQMGLKAKLVCDPIQITLPKEYISGEKRVSRESKGQDDAFLLEYKNNIAVALDALINAIAPKKAE
ncbi:uncharacterized protein FA14DRAFT_39205 [Meira miltonrushii]|uniref:NADPH-dependent FMN reductase-like domain-containing protein n=1 Tax=Meira miltonrushii TaxID=1280837 RepID=A0A316VCM2_9BASI|nr:uncharacterized protein FA14DRAFT_39205 [Meira miltonrushii]PWN35230.1 hypothetical protein FA14DRAFT_39205 [Meira miltonrushii]